MSRRADLIPLPLPTNATRTGPIIEYRKLKLFLKYDHEKVNGPLEWVSLSFDEVLAYQVYDEAASSAEQVISNAGVQIRKESAWLAQILSRWTEHVGWQEYEQALGGEKRFKHYQLYFDDVCVIEVIASACNVNADEIDS